jgi:hydroxymethylpyrimidine/phosphomethylpyrimidine kinase
MRIPRVLTIAGSDPSGGAGIQADLKMFSQLKVYGMAVPSALTAQNTTGVSAVMAVPADFLEKQLDSVLSDIRPDAVKTGMLHTRANIDLVASRIGSQKLCNIVVDPVMVSTSGARLLHEDAVDSMRGLFRVATVITPNLDEARLLTGIEIRNVDHMKDAAARLREAGPECVLVKGGHLDGDAIDVFYDGVAFHVLQSSRLPAPHSHGTGCVLSAAIAAHLARGQSVIESVRLAKAVVEGAIRNGLSIGSGSGPCDPLGLREEWHNDDPD